MNGTSKPDGAVRPDQAVFAYDPDGYSVDFCQPTESHYVPGEGGVPIAVDLWLPGGASQLRPSAVIFTRYWRGNAAPSAEISKGLQPVVRHFGAAGYAVMIVDVRGTGASFGARESEWAPSEIRDFNPIFDWVMAQPWSNGRIVTIGTSYAGNTAELALLGRHPALAAVVPRFSDFTEYQHAFRPGGVRNLVISDHWVDFVTALDRNDVFAAMQARGEHARKEWVDGVRPVRGQEPLLAEAIGQHEGNVDLHRVMSGLTFADDPFGAPTNPRLTLESISPSGSIATIASSNVPQMHWASWFDGGTADGALTRFINYRGPMHVVIGPWNHGGTTDADQFGGNQGGVPSVSVAQQHAAILTYLEPLVRPTNGADNAVPAAGDERVIHYHVSLLDEWRQTDIWPPKGSRLQRFYCSSQAELATEPQAFGEDRYHVNHDISTGDFNRWTTQLGANVAYGDRRDVDADLLTYTTPPLEYDLELAGTPILHARLRSTREDGALFAYLETVSPDGTVTYLTDGVLRLIFRDADGTATEYRQLGIMPGFLREEAQAVVPGEVFVARFSLNPLAVRIPAGYRVRLAISGSDDGTFGRLPTLGDAPVYHFQRGGADGSFVELPVIPSHEP